MLHDDLRSSLRGLIREPLYAAAVIGTFVLTLGAATAVFSIVNGVLLRPLPFPAPERLVSIREVVLRWADQYPTLPANMRHFDVWRERATTFEALAALDWRTMNVGGAGEPVQATVLRASGTLFDVLQPAMGMGRALTRDDERLDRPRVTVISHRLWQDRLGSDPGVLGRTLKIGGTDYTIVGVCQPGFAVPAVPSGDAARLRSDFAAVIPFRLNLENAQWLGSFNYAVLARIRPNVTIDDARAELGVLQQAVAATTSQHAGETIELRAQVTALHEVVTRGARSGLLLLLGAVGALLLMACANLANLSLTRTLGRLRETAVRSALGASRSRLIRLVVVEQLVLAAAGGALGVLLAQQALALFVRIAPIDFPRVDAIGVDARVLVFAAVVALGSGLAVALVPGWRLARHDVQPLLRSGGHGSTDRGGTRVRNTLLGAQIALSVALLAVTGLFAASFVRLLSVDPGFSAQDVVTLEISPLQTRYPDVATRAALYDRIAEGARQLPDVRALAWTSALPLTGETWVDGVAAVGSAARAGEIPHANYRFVGPDYFRVLSMPLLKGRSFEDRDRTRAITPAVISARAAMTLWPGAEPVGRLFTRGDPSVRFEVVGVVVDGRTTALETESPLMVYVPYWFNSEGKSLLLASVAGDAAAAIRGLRGVVRDVDPEIAIGDARPLQQVVEAARGGRQHQVALLVAFGAAALLIAIVGVYATTAFGVSRRRREMNIRVALGAPVRAVFGLVLRQTAVPVGIGVAGGCALAFALGGVVASFLFEVGSRDPLVMTAASLVVGAAGLLSAAVAARRGLRIDPVEALRAD